MSNPPPQGYQGGGYQGGGYPPPGGGGKTQVLGLDNNVAAMLCYALFFMCCFNLVPGILFLVTEPRENRFLRFHALQAILVTAAAFVIIAILNFVRMAFYTSTYTVGTGLAGIFAGGFVRLIQFVVWLIFVAISFVGAMQSYQGKTWKLPLIGDIAEKNS